MAAISAAPFPLTRGRLAALVIGVPVCLGLIALNGLSLVANLGEAHYPVHYLVPAPAKSLNVSVAGGQLTIRPTTAGQATLTGTAYYSLVRSKLTEQTTGSDTSVAYHCVIPTGDCELDANVNVPAALPVTANTDGGDAAVTGTTGQVTLSSGGGNISADQTMGPLTLNTSGGNIQATALRSLTVTATTGGGDIEIDFAGVPRDVHVDTSGGNITLVLPRGTTMYHVIAHTDGGNVTDSLPQDLHSSNEITATSGGGNITILQR
jgi:Putative adhesin